MLPIPIRKRIRTEPSLSSFFRDPAEFFGWPWAEEEEGRPLTGAYPVDVYEEDGTVKVDAEMPGFAKDEIDVQLEQDVLRISAERKSEERKGTNHLRERRFTRFERAFSLPGPVDESKVEAKLEDGVLHIQMPRIKEQAPQQIAIK